MRYLMLPLFALALNLVGTDIASAERHQLSGEGRQHVPSWWGNHTGKLHKKSARRPVEVPELDGATLPAALTLLVGATVIVIGRRRRSDAAQ